MACHLITSGLWLISLVLCSLLSTILIPVCCQRTFPSRPTRTLPMTPTAPLTTTPPTITPSTMTPKACDDGMWLCDNGEECIQELYRCDGDFDCTDRSDEKITMCVFLPCDEDEQFECVKNRGTNNTKVCIPISYLCDLDNDCGDNSDEDPANCPTTTTLQPTTTTAPCPSSEFFCPASRDRGCIPINLKCDTKFDCMNGEDERGCVYTNCSQSSEFRCHSGQCIDKILVCNGQADCRDGSDELPELCDKPKPTCELHEFQCNNGKCLVWYKVLCNGVDDCGDNSDEEICKTFRQNECSNKTLNHCSQGCEEMTFGYKCTCKPGYALDTTDMTSCNDMDECTETPGVCHQLCDNTEGSYKCSCSRGYQDVNGDGKLCKRLDSIEPFLIFGNKYYIRRVNTDGTGFASISSEHTYTHVLDYDYKNKMIYFADAPSLKQTIKRMNFDGSGKEVIESNHAAGIEGIAVDWVGNNIYWTSNKQWGMFVAKKDGTSVKVLVNKYSKQPRAIVLHPKSGYMFWTDWSLEPFIAKMGMDGSKLQKVITKGLFWPNGLTIDYATDTLWWVDAHLDQMETSDFSGKGRRVVVTDMPHPYALSVFEDYAFWSEWNLLRIERVDRLTGANRTVLTTTLQLPYDIHVVHPLRQPNVKNPCNPNNGGCSHLCLLAPGWLPGQPSYRCACPEHFVMGSDGKTCKINCTLGHFVCPAPDEKCIPKRFVCNGKFDCKGGEDEKDCGNPVCEETYFRCGNSTQCVPSWRLCDNVKNCGNGADEAVDLCSTLECMSYEFRCKSGQCIPLAWVCDGDNDCSDASDEEPVNEQCTNCDPKKHFKCDNGKCIPRIWKCDWDDDCGDLSDEPRNECYEMRKHTPCPAGWFTCEHNYRCIPSTNLCDGNDDCRDGSDETADKCPECPRGDFHCTNGTPSCIPARWQCDFRNDCADGSDENPTTCVYRNCSETEFRCNNQKCIRFDQRCDGIDNCQDGGKGSDERNCPALTCSPHEFSCTESNQCLSYDMVCDGIIHCDDASDEMHCGTRSPDGSYCRDDQFQCANKACIPKAYVCDGEDDCKDNSDEVKSACLGIDCTGVHQFRCNTTQRCIDSFLKCNGIDDCGDNSDEKNCKPTCYSETQFTCPNGSCIPLKAVCDGVNDCSDQVGMTKLSSDEVGCVRSEYCSKNSCQHICVNVTNQGVPYHKCECNPGFIHARYAAEECEELNECSSLRYHTCQQICTNTKGSYHCSCAYGYTDGGYHSHTCIPVDTTSMLYTIGHTMKNFVPRSGSLMDVVSQQRNIDALAADMINNIVYWSDPSLKRIYRSLIPTKAADLGQPQDLGITKIGKVEDIAYDWMGDNLYYLDSVLNIIAVSKANWKYIKTLKRIRTQNTLKSIAVNSKLGLMFWSEFESSYTNGAIRRANMSGYGNSHKILSQGLGLPASITVDYYMNGRLYWIDRAKNTIESANYDGTDHLIIANVHYHPHSLDVFGSTLFFTTQSNRSINSIDKFGRTRTIEHVYQATVLINDIFIFSKQKYPMESRDNRCLKIKCNGLCLPEPGSARCVCPDSWRKISNEECERPSNFEALSKPQLCRCENGGTCIMYLDMTCRCPDGFTGRWCEKVIGTETSRKTITTTTATTTAVRELSTKHSYVQPVESPYKHSQLIAAIVAPVIISVIILGLVGLVIYWLRSRYALGKMMSGHGEVRRGQPGMNGQREATPHDHIVAEAAGYDHGTPIQREISFEDGAVRFSNPIYDTVPKKNRPPEDAGAAPMSASPQSVPSQDINTNKIYTPAAVSVPETRNEPLTVAEAVAGLSEINIDTDQVKDH